jgi:hypothetical protein
MDMANSSKLYKSDLVTLCVFPGNVRVLPFLPTYEKETKSVPPTSLVYFSDQGEVSNLLSVEPGLVEKRHNFYIYLKMNLLEILHIEFDYHFVLQTVDSL